MNLAHRSIVVLGLALVIVNCSKGKTPNTADATATSANGSSVNVLGLYDLNTISQIQFETSSTNSFRPAPGPNDVASKILILVMNGASVAQSGVYVKTGDGQSCQASVAAFSTNDLVQALGEAVVGPNSHNYVAPDAGFDRLSLFFKDGTSTVIPFDDVGAPINQKVILEAADEPLNDLLRSLYASGNCSANR